MKEAELLFTGQLMQEGISEMPPLGAKPGAQAKFGHICTSASQGSKLHMTSIQLQFIARKKWQNKHLLCMKGSLQVSETVN